MYYADRLFCESIKFETSGVDLHQFVTLYFTFTDICHCIEQRGISRQKQGGCGHSVAEFDSHISARDGETKVKAQTLVSLKVTVTLAMSLLQTNA